jgi:hypothetical protein
MKIKLYTISAFVAITLFINYSCKKDNKSVAPASVEGFWSGKYSVGALEPTIFYYGSLFRNNGTVRVYFSNNFNSDTTNASKREGTYKYENGVVSTTYIINPNEFLTTATFTTSTRMNGTYGFSPNSNNDAGKFYLNKE